MGAGAVTSNVKQDRTLVTVKTPEGRLETGLKKFGAILGDHVEVGCNSVLNPGTVVGRGSGCIPSPWCVVWCRKGTFIKMQGKSWKSTIDRGCLTAGGMVRCRISA